MLHIELRVEQSHNGRCSFVPVLDPLVEIHRDLVVPNDLQALTSQVQVSFASFEHFVAINLTENGARLIGLVDAPLLYGFPQFESRVDVVLEPHRLAKVELLIAFQLYALLLLVIALFQDGFSLC